MWTRIAEGGLMLLTGQAPQHQTDHADPDPTLARTRLPLVIPSVDPAPPQPGEGPFHHPTPHDYHEALAPGRATHHLDHVPAMLRRPAVEAVVVVLDIRPEPLPAGELPSSEGPRRE